MDGSGNVLRFYQQEALSFGAGELLTTPWRPVPDWVKSAEFVVQCWGLYSGQLDIRLQTSVDQTTTSVLATEPVTAIGTNRYQLTSGIGRFVRLDMSVPSGAGATSLTVSVYVILQTSE